jgi:hypothetical protein
MKLGNHENGKRLRLSGMIDLQKFNEKNHSKATSVLMPVKAKCVYLHETAENMSNRMHPSAISTNTKGICDGKMHRSAIINAPYGPEKQAMCQPYLYLLRQNYVA